MATGELRMSSIGRWYEVRCRINLTSCSTLIQSVQTIEVIILGKDKETHSIRSQQIFCFPDSLKTILKMTSIHTKHIVSQGRGYFYIRGNRNFSRIQMMIRRKNFTKKFQQEPEHQSVSFFIFRNDSLHD